MPEPQHLSAEFSFNPTGHVKTVTQGEPECVAARVFHVAVCPEGFREDDPSYGVPELVFQSVPLNLKPFEAAIRRSEPEATLEATERAFSRIQSQREVGLEVS